MSDISSIGHAGNPGHHGPHVNGSTPVNRNDAPYTYGSTGRADAADLRLSQTDRVELSDAARAEHARWMESLRQLPPIRFEKVRAAKDAIDAGSYETKEKLDIAIERLLEDIE